MVVVVGDNPHQSSPMLKSHIAGIDRRVEGTRMNFVIETLQFRHFFEDEVEVETFESSRLRILPHSYGSACINKEYTWAMCLIIAHAIWYICAKLQKSLLITGYV